MSTDQAKEAQAIYEGTLLQKQNVVGVGVGYKESNGERSDQVAVVVLVEEKKPVAALRDEDLIPRELDGMRTDVVEVGYLRAQQSARERYRPIIPSGVSIGHYKVTAGTLGTIVKDRTTSELFLLSNNHVLANCNDALVNDPVLQPAAMDGGQNPADVVAKLERFIKLKFIGDPVDTPPINPPQPPPVTPPPGTPPQGCDITAVIAAIANFLAALVGSERRLTPQTLSAQTAGATGTLRALDASAVPENHLDAALARPIDPNMFSDDIKNIGMVNETKEPVLGMRVRKFGRTTEYTEGNITLLNATVNIGYNTIHGQRTARFVGQTIAESMSQGGDSGSLVVDAVENKAVGLLFAGSNLATIFTPINVVLDALNITL
ncbi:MAG TPA: hypothetical protein VK003_15770 [Oceanobacillus sp.]|nr:hypothetical protein [Oceanobacillus sp.]